MNFPSVSFTNKEELKKICRNALQRTTKYNLSHDFEIKQLKGVIFDQTSYLDQSVSLSKRVNHIVYRILSLRSLWKRNDRR